MSEYTLEEFVAARNEALLSLDEAKIRAFFQKYNNTHLPTNMLTFWGSVHKDITDVPSFPIELRRASKSWLEERGLKSHDDGDL